MDRIREARRGSMAAVNGSLSRRRQRSSSLRDSPEEDGAMEMQETSRLRDRGAKKDRDRDRSGRSKRRRGDRMLHGSHREEGEDSSEESVDEDEEDEEEDSSVVAVRLQPPLAPNPAPAVSGMQSHNIRKGYPVKPVRPPGTCTWKVVEEMIGAPIPRKARSSSVKRSQECWVSGGGGGCGGGGEQVPYQASMSPVRRSPSSTAPVSPSSSNVSIRKKMKPITVPKPRPPKTSKSSSIQEIEIEVAEVLFGMTRQVPSKQDDHRHDPKESNGSGNEVKSRVSSPNPISPPAASQPSTVRPSNPSSNSFPLTATAPKRKRPRMRIEDESPTSPPSSTVLPAISSSSAAKLDTEVVPPPIGTKTEPASPRSEKNASPAVENGGVSSDQAVSNVSSSIVFAAKAQQDSVKAESIPDLKETDSRTEKKSKEEAFSPPKESPAANLDVNIEEAPASKASAMISDTQREEKFSIDLMAPPGKSSPEIECNSDYVSECKSVEREDAPKPEISKAEVEKVEKKSKSEPEEIAQDDKNGGMPSTDGSDSRKQAGKERNLDLQHDLEKLDKDVTGASKHQVLKQQSKTPRAEPKTEKAGPTASLPMPMQITGWPGGFPPFGFMGQVPPQPPVVPVDGSLSSSKQSLLPSQLRPKRCAAHCYIAQNIHYHQQITRLNPFWPSAAGAAPLYASKQYNLNTAPPSDSAILGSPLQGSFPGRSLGSVQEKGLPASTAHSVLPAKDKSNVATQFMDVSQRKPPTLQQSSLPGSAGNMLAPAFIFPLNQQQAAAAGAAAVGAAASNRSGVAKLPQGSGNTAQSSSSTGYAAVGASGANGSGTNMSFNYPGLPPNEAPYLAFLPNNTYSFPIPAHVGGAQPYRGASPAQAMPFFNLSFYPSQMLHPSQLRLQQQPPSSQQPPYSQQGHQNPSTSSGSSSSQKNTQQSKRVPAAASAITAGNSHGFPSSKQQHLPHSHQARQLEPEPGGEDAPSTADSRVSQSQKNIYTQKFAMPAHSQNFALIAPAAAALSSGVGNQSEKQQQQQSQNQVMKVDLTPSQAFAMSFASFGGTAASAAAGGAAPHGLDFSSMAQNHAIFQSLPETVRHGYQVSAAAAAAHSTQQQQQQQQQLHNKKLEDGKSVTDLGNTGTIGEEGKISSASKVLGNAQQHSLTFSRADTDSAISSILTNSVIDSSSRTLNLIQTPPSGAPRVSSRPASAAPASNSVTNSSNSQHLLSQQHQQQVLQLPKQVQQLHLQQQQQQQQLQQQQRAKSASSHSNASLYTDRLPGNSTASKFPSGIAGFPPTLIQSSASSQSAQWKASTRAANSASAAASPSASSPVKNQIPLQQQVRSQQPPAHQTHQISFGVSPSKVAGQLGQHLAAAGNNATASLSSATTIAVGSPQNSVSKSSSGSPHSSAIAKSGPPPSSIPSVMPFQKQQSGKNSSSNSTISPLPATNRNSPSILGNPHITTPQNLGSKPQPSSQHLQQSQMPKQHSPQAQLFFSYPYMQSQTSQSDAAAAAAGYFQQHHRRQSDQQRQNSTPASTGMLSLGPSSSLSLAAAPDPSKGAGAAATSNSKNLMPTSLLQHPAQFATISQPGSGANAAAGHPLMYIHAMQSVPLKPDVSASADQKPAAGR